MMLLHRSVEELKDWTQLRTTEYLAEVVSLPGTKYRWLYESLNGTYVSGGVLVEFDGVRIRRVCPNGL